MSNTKETGTVWEVQAPSGEHLLMIVVEDHSSEQAPFDFVRAVPLSDFVRLTSNDDAVVLVEPDCEIMAAHCWLEGPVLSESLVRAVGKIAPDCLPALHHARSSGEVTDLAENVSLFRDSLFEQFDAVFCAAWQRLAEVA